MILTAEQLDALKRGDTVRVSSAEVGEDLIVVRASTLEELTESLQDENEKRAWAKLGMHAASRWAKENPY